MTLAYLMLLAATQDRPSPACEGVQADAAAYRLGDLPSDIREDLKSVTRNTIGDSDGPLLNTDSIGPAEAKMPETQFFRGLRIKGEWYVQFEVSLFAGVRTIGYRHAQEDGRWHLRPGLYFSGPPCASLKAALAGVSTPNGDVRR